MLFNSYEFIFLFLPTTLAVVYLLVASHHARLAVWWIGLASLAFYGFGELRFLPILLGSIFFNFAVGHIIVSASGPRRRRLVTVFGVTANLVVLGVFKFAGFAAETVSVATDLAVPIPAIALPIGISFYTFTQIAYLVDCGARPEGKLPPRGLPAVRHFLPASRRGSDSPPQKHNPPAPAVSFRPSGRAAVHAGVDLLQRRSVQEGAGR